MLWTIPLDGKGEPRKLPSLRYDGTSGVSWNDRRPDPVHDTGPRRAADLVDGCGRLEPSRAHDRREQRLAAPLPRRPLRRVLRGSRRAARDLADESGRDRPTPRRGRAERVVLRHDARRPVDHVHHAIRMARRRSGEWPAPAGRRSAWSNGSSVRSLSPAGDRAFGVLSRGNRYGVAVVPLAGGEPTWVPSDGSAATGFGGIFQWAPDRNGVYFTTAERINLFFYRFGAPAQTSVTHFSDAMSSERRDLTRRPHDARHPRGASEGRVPDHELPLAVRGKGNGRATEARSLRSGKGL